ncbi:hypothetical protein PPACK8108_LOCUS22964 [Phakopsora pachyrhizi]|uniref:Uncharacterized protein n=1 Tax=Phakopsora pachyrhizi TaxID=170000 RepID=A0AAV0BLX6_PHAPC|nr:hypothetical protein PPACK8108_LOCUS22964 [Phakopsora pachyrhizi]
MKIESYFKQAYGGWKLELFQYQTIQSALDEDSEKSDALPCSTANSPKLSSPIFYQILQCTPTQPLYTSIPTQYLASKPD